MKLYVNLLTTADKYTPNSEIYANKLPQLLFVADFVQSKTQHHPQIFTKRKITSVADSAV